MDRGGRGVRGPGWSGLRRSRRTPGQRPARDRNLRGRLLRGELHAGPHGGGPAPAHRDRAPPARRPPLPQLVGRHAVRARPAGRRDRRQLALPRAHARAADGGGAPRVEAGVGDGAPRAPRSDDLASEPRSAPPADGRRPPERRAGDGAAQHRPRPLPGRERHARPRAGRRGPDRDRREAEALRAIDGHGRARGGGPFRRAAARPPKRQGRCGRGRREDRGGPEPPDRRGERHAERGRHRRDRVRPRSRQQRRAAAPARGGGDVPREARADAARVLLTRARGGGAAPARARDRA